METAVFQFDISSLLREIACQQCRLDFLSDEFASELSQCFYHEICRYEKSNLTAAQTAARDRDSVPRCLLRAASLRAQ